MLLFVSAVKLLAEIALLAMIGQWLLGVLAGARRHTNFFYRTLQVVTTPVVRCVRLLTPRIVIDRHVPLVAFLLLGFGWVLATAYKIRLCLQIGVQACQ